MGAKKDRKNQLSEIPFKYWCHVTSGSTYYNAIDLSPTGAAVPIRQSRTTNDDLITTSEYISADTLTLET